MSFSVLKTTVIDYTYKFGQKALAHASFSRGQLARARELGVKSEKLLELKKLANETRRKTVSMEELEKKISASRVKEYFPKMLKDISEKTGVTYGYESTKLENYAQTVVEEDGTMVKLLSNGLKVKVRPQADGSRIREVFDINGKKVYDDVIKTSQYNAANKKVCTKDVNSNFYVYYNFGSSSSKLRVNNYHRINEKEYLSGEFFQKRLKVDGGTFEYRKNFITSYFTSHSHVSSGKGTTNSYIETYTGRKKKIIADLDGNKYEYTQFKPNSEKYTVKVDSKNPNPRFKDYHNGKMFSQLYNDNVPEYITQDWV